MLDFSGMSFSSTEAILKDFKQGKFVLLVDDENRENEGDLILAADFVTSEKINFMTREARGLICLAMSSNQVERLELPLMTSAKHQSGKHCAAFTISIDAATGIESGISSSDRARTIWLASRPDAQPTDVICPGHIFPLKAKSGGVLERAGHTEAGVDLARLCGLSAASVLCEMLNEDGSIARLEDLKRFSEKHDIKLGQVADLIFYIQQTNKL